MNPNIDNQVYCAGCPEMLQEGEREWSKMSSKIALVSQSLDLAAWRLLNKPLSTEWML